MSSGWLQIPHPLPPSGIDGSDCTLVTNSCLSFSSYDIVFLSWGRNPTPTVFAPSDPPVTIRPSRDLAPKAPAPVIAFTRIL